MVAVYETLNELRGLMLHGSANGCIQMRTRRGDGRTCSGLEGSVTASHDTKVERYYVSSEIMRLSLLEE